MHVLISDGDASYGQRQREAERRRLLDVIASGTAGQVVRDHYWVEGCVNLGCTEMEARDLRNLSSYITRVPLQ